MLRIQNRAHPISQKKVATWKKENPGANGSFEQAALPLAG